MFTSKIRTSIITAVAALSVLAVGPMTPVASARIKITVTHVEQLCVHENEDGSKTYNKEGDRVTMKSKDGKTTIELECKEGEWKRVAQAGTLSQPKEVLSGPLPAAGV
jgi:hypothetical protein